MTSQPRIFTVGHSNRSIKEFIELLESYKLKLVVDIRTIPKSRHNPQFGEKRLARSLAKAGIEYVRMTGLGGLRPTSCHRSLVADALLVHGLPAEEIFTKTSHRRHKLTSFAKVKGKQITYPSDDR